MADLVGEKKYPLLARFSLIYLVMIGSVFIITSVFGDILDKTPDYKITIPLFLLLVAVNFVNDMYLINRSLIARNIINLLVNISGLFYLLSMAGTNDHKYWVMLIAFSVSWAFFFTTEFYSIIVVSVSLGYFLLMYYLMKGNIPPMNLLDIFAKMGAILVSGFWIKHLVNLIDKEIRHNNKILSEKNDKSQSLLSNVVKTIYSALETKDVMIRKHSQRVIEYSLDIAEELRLSPEETEKLKTAALLHDIGKMKISDIILKKTDRLTKAEMDVVKRHPIDALNILEPIDEFQHVLIHIKYHHERWDGTGYPEGLKGETIPLLARILSVANAFDAMTSDRVYQRRMEEKDAVEELKKNKGSQFDPKIVDALVKKIEKSLKKKK